MFDYQFSGSVELQKEKGFRHHFVRLPDDLDPKLPPGRRKRLRIDGEIDRLPFNRALYQIDGRWRLMVSLAMLKKIGRQEGDHVWIEFSVADQDAVDVPRELETAIRASRAAERVWDQLTSGKKRSFVYWVTSAKREATQIKRIDEVIDRLKTGRL